MSDDHDQRYLIISTMKDEAPYVLEWVAWYYTIGFTDILVYTNDCTDGTDLMLQRLEQLGLVKHEYNPVLKRGPHKSALKFAMEHPLYAETDWAFVCDGDEFLNIHYGGGKIPDLRAAYPQADVIPVVWRTFSNNGQINISDGMITSEMTDAAPFPDGEKTAKVGFIKTVFRNDERVERLGLHRPFFHENAGEIWSLKPPSDEDPLRLVGELGQDVAQLNHYAVRSLESFIIKRDRGRANHTSKRIGPDYWQRWNQGGAEDRSLLRHHAEHKVQFDRLMADPILAALHKAAHEIHHTRFREILENDPEAREIYEQIVAEISPTPPTRVAPIPAPVAASEPDTAEETVAPVPTPVPAASAGMADPHEAQEIIDAILKESDRNRRAPKRRLLRQAMLDEVMPKGGRCAEIGVWEGDFSAEILNITKPQKLVLIDPWDLLAEKTDEHTHSQHAEAELMRAKYDQIMATLGRLPNCVVRKGFSAEVLETYPDGYFDWVYIDGNHLYEFVLQDILVASRKVRPGGIIAGDDLYWKKDDYMHVREAVREAMRQLGDRATQTRRGAQFIIKLAEDGAN